MRKFDDLKENFLRLFKISSDWENMGFDRLLVRAEQWTGAIHGKVRPTKAQKQELNNIYVERKLNHFKGAKFEAEINKGKKAAFPLNVLYEAIIGEKQPVMASDKTWSEMLRPVLQAEVKGTKAVRHAATMAVLELLNNNTI